jgi:hypothetical protein
MTSSNSAQDRQCSGGKKAWTEREAKMKMDMHATVQDYYLQLAIKNK